MEIGSRPSSWQTSIAALAMSAIAATAGKNEEKGD
jgi:hypothetical protein